MPDKFKMFSLRSGRVLFAFGACSSSRSALLLPRKTLPSLARHFKICLANNRFHSFTNKHKNSRVTETGYTMCYFHDIVCTRHLTCALGPRPANSGDSKCPCTETKRMPSREEVSFSALYDFCLDAVLWYLKGPLIVLNFASLVKVFVSVCGPPTEVTASGPAVSPHIPRHVHRSPRIVQKHRPSLRALFNFWSLLRSGSNALWLTKSRF